MHEKISYWLGGNQDYELGLSMLKEIGASGTLLFALEMGESPFNRELLQEALNEFVSSKISTQKVTNSHEKKKRIRFAINKDELPRELQIEYEKLKPIYGRAAALKAQLKHMSGKQRQDACFEIVGAFRATRAIYKAIDLFYETGEYLKEPDFEHKLHSRYIEMMMALKTYPSYISKFSKDPEKAAEVARRRKELENINETIKNGRIIQI